MNSTAYTCTHCLRGLRRAARAEKLRSFTVANETARSVRVFSARSPYLQQAVREERPSSLSPAPAPKANSDNGPSTAEMQRQIASRLGSSRPDLSTAIAQRLRKTARKTTDSYITYGLTEALFKKCSVEADYTIPENQRQGLLTGTGPTKTASGEDLGESEGQSWWFDTIGLEPTFSTWSQVTYLHMYLLTVRLRALEDTSAFQNYQRYLLEHFSHAAEDKMLIFHGMAARGIRNRYLKDLFLQWRGLLAAYDEGLVKGDAVLAGAVWRNLFKGDEEVDWNKVAEVVAYIRKSIIMLGDVELSDINDSLQEAGGLFNSAKKNLPTLVAAQSTGMSETSSDEK